jgi:hypothetical protein
LGTASGANAKTLSTSWVKGTIFSQRLTHMWKIWGLVSIDCCWGRWDVNLNHQFGLVFPDPRRSALPKRFITPLAGRHQS